MKNIIKVGCLMLILMTTFLFGADGGAMEWIGQVWKPVVSVLALIAGGFYVPGARVLMYHAVKAAISGPVLKRLVIRALKNYAARSDNDVVEEFVEQFIKNTKNVKGIEKKVK